MPPLNLLNSYGATEMSQPVLRLPPNRPHTPASEAGSTHSIEPAPGGMAPSAQMKALCVAISEAAKARQPNSVKVRKLLAAYRQSDLTRMLKQASGGNSVRRTHPSHLELTESIEHHRGRVIILDTLGFPQYAFEHVDGEWRGFDGALRPLPPGKCDPVAMLTSLISSGPMGLMFTRYIIEGGVSVLREESAGDGQRPPANTPEGGPTPPESGRTTPERLLEAPREVSHAEEDEPVVAPTTRSSVSLPSPTLSQRGIHDE